MKPFLIFISFLQRWNRCFFLLSGKILLPLLPILFSTYSAKGQQSGLFINPDGVYKYQGKTYKKDGDIFGYFGTIKVLQLDTNKILINFFICKGAPSYNSGSFIDTFYYTNNQATYYGDTSLPELACTLNFDFNLKGVNVRLFSKDTNPVCDFGMNVSPNGFFKRVKTKAPTKKEILEDSK